MYCVVHCWLSFLYFFQVFLKYFLQLLNLCLQSIYLCLQINTLFVIYLFITCLYFQDFGSSLLWLLWILFSGKLHISSSFLWSCVLPCSFICYMFLCIFIFFNVFGVSFLKAERLLFLLIVGSAPMGGIFCLYHLSIDVREVFRVPLCHCITINVSFYSYK